MEVMVPTSLISQRQCINGSAHQGHRKLHFPLLAAEDRFEGTTPRFLVSSIWRHQKLDLGQMWDLGLLGQWSYEQPPDLTALPTTSGKPQAVVRVISAGCDTPPCH